MPGQEFADGLLLWLTVVSTVTVVAAKPWTWAKAIAQARAAREKHYAELAAHAADVACKQLLDKLMSPNGGKSLHDIAAQVSAVQMEQARVASQVEAIDQRTDRLERQVDGTLIPRQTDIARKVGADKRETDHV